MASSGRVGGDVSSSSIRTNTDADDTRVCRKELQQQVCASARGAFFQVHFVQKGAGMTRIELVMHPA